MNFKLKDLIKKKYWIWLSLIPNLGSKTKIKLLEIYKKPEVIYNLNEQELMKIHGIGEKIATNILNKSIKQKIDAHISYMYKNNIDIISIFDVQYPDILKEIYDPPISLYCKGNTEILKNKAIGIVGCRDATEYGISCAKYFSYNLALQGINVVSGLAKGIDSYAHIGTICAQKSENCGKTVAVLAHGLDMIYPKENIGLANKILKSGGCIISEYPLGTKLNRMNFPARNRIVSGLSKGIIVIEAKEKSGTLITVDFALEQGRDVFAVPGNINSINSVGTNELIRQGAKIITNYNEIFLQKY